MRVDEYKAGPGNDHIFSVSPLTRLIRPTRDHREEGNVVHSAVQPLSLTCEQP